MWCDVLDKHHAFTIKSGSIMYIRVVHWMDSGSSRVRVEVAWVGKIWEGVIAIVDTLWQQSEHFEGKGKKNTISSSFG
jgi:hypothetical protein